MRRGPWHQCGDRSQNLVVEQLDSGAGVGVILSSRDVSFRRAGELARDYHRLDAEVLIDTQFYVPGFSNRWSETYPTAEFRLTITQLMQMITQQQNRFVAALVEMNASIEADALLAPAVLYEAGRQDIVDINRFLFSLAQQAGSELDIPVYSTVALSHSVTGSDATIIPTLGYATAAPADGWYYIFEFDDCRMPSSTEEIYRCCATGLTLACTGKPVLHAYAGPLGLLSFGFGATGVGVGHNQKLWHFKRDRWEDSLTDQGGGGEAPARYFSKTLWGTIVEPDETSQLSAELRAEVMGETDFYVSGDRWSAGKHLVHVLCTALTEVAQNNDPRRNAQAAMHLLQRAVVLHRRIAESGIRLRDDTNVYQANWASVIPDLLENKPDDYDWLQLT